MSYKQISKDIIKKTFTITPESGSNNGSISINAKANTDINAVQETIAKKQLSKASVVLQGGGINKSIANDYASVPLFVKMMRQKSEPNVSDTCNLVIA